MTRLLAASFIAATLFLSATPAQTPTPQTSPPTISKLNEVASLKLPPSQTVNYDEGFISLHADTTGTVNWLVLSTNKRVKYRVIPSSPNDIDIAIPPFQSSISVFAVAVINGQLTQFARTDITINGPPEPAPTPPAPAVVLPLHLSFIEDPTKRTDAIKGIIESTTLRAQLTAKNIQVRQYTTTDPTLAAKNFTSPLQQYGAPLMILQDNTGRALVIGPLPATPAALLQLIGPYVQKGD